MGPGRAFRVLVDKATEHLDVSKDREVLERGWVLHGLFLDKLDPEQAHRLAVAMRAAAEPLRSELLQSSTEWDQSFADSLSDFALRLTELASPEGC
jgi:hypothetical protein